MADTPDDLTAAEYVLGTLDAAERRAFLLRLAREPAAVEAVASWQRRLAPLALASADHVPPASLWPRIETQLFGTGVHANDNRGVARGWRTAAIAASVIACAAGLGVWQQTSRSRDAGFGAGAMAALTSAGQAPVMLVTYDAAQRRINILPVALDERPGHSMELWLIAGTSAPKSLGTLAAHVQRTMGLALDPAAEATFAVSVEPVGGSPTGAPTGPVIYSGKMVKVTPET